MENLGLFKKNRLTEDKLINKFESKSKNLYYLVYSKNRTI